MAILIILVISALLAWACVAVANSKGRNPWLWGILGFLFNAVALIVIAALPSVTPSRYDVAPSQVGGVRDCPQCGAENDWGSGYCANCGASLRLAPQLESRVATRTRFVTPLVGLIVGLVFALILLQATMLSAETLAETILGEGTASQEQLERLRQELGEAQPGVVLFWPVSPGLRSLVNDQSVPSQVWRRLPNTLQIVIMGGGLAVLLAWGLALGLRYNHPGTTAGRLSVASLAAMPVFWMGLLMVLVMARYFDWLPPLGYFTLWDDPTNNLRQTFWPIAVVGIIRGLWTALEMRSREDASPLVVLARTVGLVLRHGGMVLSVVIVLELVFGIPGLGTLLVQSASRMDTPVLGASAAALIWLALWSRLFGNLLLATVDRNTPARIEAPRETESGVTLAIGGGVIFGLLVLLFLVPFGAPQDPVSYTLTSRLVGPSGAHWFGTDQLGRDVFSRVLHGGRSVAAMGLPMSLLALLVGVPMVVARVVLDRANAPELVRGVEGVLEGLVAVPWLVIGILVQGNLGAGWPFVALTIMLVPRALRVGWALGAGERLQAIHVAYAALRLGALFLAAALAMSAALGFLGLGVPPPNAELGLMLAGGGQFITAAPWIVIFPGLVISLIAAAWLAVATLVSRSGPEYRAVGWVHTMS